MIILSLLSSTELCAWGRTGHAWIGRMAAELAPEGREFWLANRYQMATLANVPDVLWKSNANANSRVEVPTHWFQIDAYASAPWELPAVFNSYSETVAEFGQEIVQTNGTASWRALEFYKLAVDTMRKGNYPRSLQMAGALAHYIGDLSQPLHVTIDYDGENESNTGIHSFFETKNIQNADAAILQAAIKERAVKLLQDPEFQESFQGSPLQAIYREIMRSAQSIRTVLDQDRQLGRGAAGSRAQMALATDRLADGTATLAILLGRIWIEGGRPDIKQEIRVPDPIWVAPQNDFIKPFLIDPIFRSVYDSARDCEE